MQRWAQDRNGMDLTEAEDIKKRWQEYTEELYKRDLHDLDNHEFWASKMCYLPIGGKDKSQGNGKGQKILQRREGEKNNRMGKTRDLFKKIRDTKGTFYAKMGSIKEQKLQGPNRSRKY